MLEPGSTLSYVTPFVGRKLDILPDVLIEPFSVCTPMGDYVVAKRVYKKCRVIVPNRVALVDFVGVEIF